MLINRLINRSKVVVALTQVALHVQGAKPAPRLDDTTWSGVARPVKVIGCGSVKNLTEGGASVGHVVHISKAVKHHTETHIKRLGYNVTFSAPASVGAGYGFTLRRRGWFGLPTGMTYKGTAASEVFLLESALGTAQRLAQGTSC